MEKTTATAQNKLDKVYYYRPLTYSCTHGERKFKARGEGKNSTHKPKVVVQLVELSRWACALLPFIKRLSYNDIKINAHN